MVYVVTSLSYIWWNSGCDIFERIILESILYNMYIHTIKKRGPIKDRLVLILFIAEVLYEL